MWRNIKHSLLLLLVFECVLTITCKGMTNTCSSEESYDFLVVDEDTSIDSTSTVNAQLSVIPDNIINHFDDSDWFLYIYSQGLGEDTEWNGTITGYIHYKGKAIFLDGDPAYISVSTIHEFGHYLDYQLGFISDTEEFLSIYEEEKASFVNSLTDNAKYIISDNNEYFAGVFSEVIVNSEDCKERIPKSYEFVMDAINNF